MALAQASSSTAGSGGGSKKDLRTYLDDLLKADPTAIKIVEEEVDPEFEATAIVHKILNDPAWPGYPGVLFKNIKGSDVPLMLNLHGTYERVALSIDSDGEVHGLLDTVAAASPNMPRPVVTAYLRSAETIGSDGELHGALKTLLSREGLQPEQIAHALNIAADNIGSDGEMSALLSDIPNLPKNHPAVRDALRRALETIGSDSQRKRVEAAVE